MGRDAHGICWRTRAVFRSNAQRVCPKLLVVPHDSLHHSEKMLCVLPFVRSIFCHSTLYTRTQNSPCVSKVGLENNTFLRIILWFPVVWLVLALAKKKELQGLRLLSKFQNDLKFVFGVFYLKFGASPSFKG